MFTCMLYIQYLLDHFCLNYGVFRTDFLFYDGKRIDISVLSQTCRSEPKESLRHVDTSYDHAIARGAFSGQFASSKNFDCSGYVTNRNLITRLLDFDVLETDELRGSNVHY